MGTLLRFLIIGHERTSIPRISMIGGQRSNFNNERTYELQNGQNDH